MGKPLPPSQDCLFKMLNRVELIDNTNGSEDMEETNRSSEIRSLNRPSFPIFNPHIEFLNQYIELLMHDKESSNDLIMRPIPFEVGSVSLELVRNSFGLNMLFPAY